LPIEAKRGCGYRHVGALYLVGSGIHFSCDALPLEITPCPTCHFTIPFTRGFLWVHKDYLWYKTEGHYYSREGCKCHHEGRLFCPICFPNKNIEDNALLMWCGSKYYTPDEFVKEAQEMGVSKRIAEIPKDLVLGKTWVLLAHPKVPFWVEGKQQNLKGEAMNERVENPAIFYVFQPQKIEMLIWKSEATSQHILELKKKGITPIVVPDNEKEHA